MNLKLTAYLLNLAAHLKDQMQSDNYQLRLQGLPTQVLNSKCPPIEKTLISDIVNLEDDVLASMRSICSKDNAAQIMFKDFQDQLNALIPKISEFQVVTQGSIVNYLNGVGACQEHTFIAAYFLMKMMQSYDLGIMDIETIYLDVPGVGNHAFLIINRDLSGDLKNVSSWGTNCLVFDPFMQWVTSSQQLPTNSALYEYANKTTLIGCQATISSRFSSLKALYGLKTFTESHTFFSIQQRTNAKLREHMLTFLNSINIEDRFPIFLQFPFVTPINEQLEFLLRQNSSEKPIQCSTAKELQRNTGIIFRTYLDSRYYSQVVSEPLSEQAETTARTFFATDSRANFVRLGGATRCVLANVNARMFQTSKARLQYS